MKLMMFAAVLATASVFGQTFVDNGAAGTSSTGTWTASTQTGFYGTAKSVLTNAAGATYTFTAPASGVTIVSLWWTAATNRCGAVPVTVWDGETQVGTVTLDQRIAGGRWVPIGTYQFASGTARVVLASTAGCYTVADGMKLEPGEEPADDPPADDNPPPADTTPPATTINPKSAFLVSWNPVTLNTDGSTCAPSGYEIWATPASVDLAATPAADTGAVKKTVAATTTSQIDVTAMIVTTTKTSWKLWVRTLDGTKFSAWSNSLSVVYDPTVPVPILPAAPTGFVGVIVLTK